MAVAPGKFDPRDAIAFVEREQTMYQENEPWRWIYEIVDEDEEELSPGKFQIQCVVHHKPSGTYWQTNWFDPDDMRITQLTEVFQKEVKLYHYEAKEDPRKFEIAI